MATFKHIRFGDGLSVTDDGSNQITVTAAGGPTGPAGPTGPTGPPGPTVDATTSTKGVVQLAGDLAGTAAAPLVKHPYGTTLPASPADGQEAVLVNSTSSPAYTWRFRYNAGSTQTFKWEFVGGAAWVGRIDMNETTTSTGFVDLATVGPSIALPRAGLYELGMSVQMTNDGAGFCIAAPAEVGIANYESLGVAADPGASHWATAAAISTLTVNGSLTIKLVYRVTSGTGAFQNRSFSVRPIRV